MGYGPVVEDGYGAAYTLYPDRIHGMISAYKPPDGRATVNRGVESFAQNLTAALNSLYDLIQQHKSQLSIASED